MCHFLSNLQFSLFFTVPIEAPNITTKINTSSTSIEIEWQPLSLNFWRGVPYGYTIYFILHDIYAISGTTKNVSFVDVLYPTVNVELTQLEKYKNYVLWMTAFTIKGRGEKNGSAVEQVTGEDGKFTFSTWNLAGALSNLDKKYSFFWNDLMQVCRC